MMFKYPRFRNGSSWCIVEADSVEWCEGWIVRVPGTPQEDGSKSHDSFHLTLNMPAPDADTLREMIPAIIEMRPAGYAVLREGDEYAVPMVVVHLKRKGNDTLPLAVHSGYILNNDGKTVESLHLPMKL